MLFLFCAAGSAVQSVECESKHFLSSVFFVYLRSTCTEKEYKDEAIEKKETFADDVYRVLSTCFVYEYQWDESILLFDQPV